MAAMSLLDGKCYSAWVSAMWDVIQRRRKESSFDDEAIYVEAVDEVSQETLSEIVRACYTGNLECNYLKVRDLLRTADYLQVSCSF